METKICSECQEPKAISEFYPNVCQCKQCVRDKQKAYRLSHKKTIAARKSQWGKSYRDSNRRELMLKRAKDRAREDKLPFNLTIDDIIIPDKCPILGISLIHQKGRPSDNSPSLDKIIPSLGYVKGNVAVISMRANTMKSNFSADELERILSYIKSHNKNADPIARSAVE